MERFKELVGMLGVFNISDFGKVYIPKGIYCMS
jgi:hypothetical protein